MTTREIKFRAWDKNTKGIIPHETLKLLPGVYGSLSDSNSSWEFMQYTGLKDKNGKEIYEGDVVLKKKDKLEITFRQGCFGVFDEDLFYPLVTLSIHALSNVNKLLDIEIIGNIYSNPELINNNL